MGFKISIVGIGPRVPREDVQSHQEGGVEAAEAVARRWFPGTEVSLLRTTGVAEASYPPDPGQVGIATFGETVLIGGWAANDDLPRLREAAQAEGAGLWQVAIHSVVDLCQFEVYATDGSALRRLMVYADISRAEAEQAAEGEPLAFEAPYWAGQHDDDYGEFPFHPLELGEAAFAWIFGMSGEGAPTDDVLESIGAVQECWDVPMHLFSLTAAAPERRGLFRRRR